MSLWLQGTFSNTLIFFLAPFVIIFLWCVCIHLKKLHLLKKKVWCLNCTTNYVYDVNTVVFILATPVTVICQLNDSGSVQFYRKKESAGILFSAEFVPMCTLNCFSVQSFPTSLSLTPFLDWIIFQYHRDRFPKVSSLDVILISHKN